MFGKVVCPDLTNRPRCYTLYKAKWEGAPDSSGRVFHSVRCSVKNGLPYGRVRFYIRNENIHSGKLDAEDDGFRLSMLMPVQGWDIMELQLRKI